MITTRKPIFKKCVNCGKEFKAVRNTVGKYCNNKCQHQHQFKIKYEKFINGDQYVFLERRSQKKAVIYRDGYYCEICKISEWNNSKIVLELDHIDGNHLNNMSENLRIICPNCHSQTENFKAKNRGNGRFNRMERYRKGLSF